MNIDKSMFIHASNEDLSSTRWSLRAWPGQRSTGGGQCGIEACGHRPVPSSGKTL